MRSIKQACVVWVGDLQRHCCDTRAEGTGSISKTV